MKKSDDLYGINCASLEEGRLLVEAALAVRLIAHESGYLGGEYYRFVDPNNEVLILQSNVDIDGERAETEHPEVPFLLYIEGTRRSGELEQRLASVPELRHLKHLER
jgi:hypothetical protein